MGAETPCSNVLLIPEINATNALINNLPTHTEPEPIINVLNTQPWLVENNATSVLTYNLPLPVAKIPPFGYMDGGVMPSVTAEPALHFPAPMWPDDINTETLVSELLARSSNIYVRIKRHTRSVQKIMHFLTKERLLC